MDLKALAEQRRASARPAPEIRNLRPSIKEFARYVTTRREELAVIGEIRAFDPDSGLRGAGEVARLAQAIAAGGAYGVSVCADAVWEGSLDDVRAAAGAVQIPVLARGPFLDEADLYRARGAGADAVVLYAALFDAERLTQLRRVAFSMKMEVVAEAGDDATLDLVLRSECPVVAIAGCDPSGRPDLASADRLLARIPKGRTPILAGGVATLEELRPLVPRVDAVILVEPVTVASALGYAEVSAVVEPFTTAVE